MSEHTAYEQAARVWHLLEIERPEQALTLLDQLLHDEPRSVALHELRACALLEVGRGVDAASAARAGLELAPDSIAALDVLALAERSLGRLGAAEEALLAGLRLEPENPVLLSHYALVLAEGGVEQKALATHARAAAIAPNNLEVMRARILLDFLLGRDDDARKRGRELLEEAPEDPVAHSILGTVASSRGYARSARRHFDEVARHDFTDRELAEVALEARAAAHPLMWPLWPLYRLGVFKFYVLGVGGMFLLLLVPHSAPFATWLVAYIFIVAYSWIAPPLIRRWVFRRR